MQQNIGTMEKPPKRPQNRLWKNNISLLIEIVEKLSKGPQTKALTTSENKKLIGYIGLILFFFKHGLQ